jgi:molecular chaperone IbpA
MPKHDFDSLFNQLESSLVGFGPTFRRFQSIATGYPPHNIIKNGENAFILEMAVAGFKKSEITIELLNGEITVKGVKSSTTGDLPEFGVVDSYQYRGIGQRSFSKSFKIAEYIEVVDARLEDGMLSITLIRNEPEAEKPKLIAIN